LSQRLTLLAFYHPNHRSYAQTNLCNTRHLWADCYSVWEMTRGIQYSNACEVWFASFKNIMGPYTTPLIGILDVVLRVVKHRNDVTYDERDEKLSAKTIPELCQLLIQYGFEGVLDNVRLHFLQDNNVAFHEVLVQMYESESYKVCMCACVWVLCVSTLIPKSLSSLYGVGFVP
jgi:hypothetical protein